MGEHEPDAHRRAGETPSDTGEDDLLLRWLEATPEQRAAFPPSPELALVAELQALGGLIAEPAGEPPQRDLPKSLGRYRIEGRLGKGAAGSVFRAFDTQLHREVALKLLEVDRSGGGSSLTATRENERERLLSEARALAQLDHPGIVRVHEVDESEGQPFLVLEIVEGPTLREALDALRRRAAPGIPADQDPEQDPEARARREAAADRLEPQAARLGLLEDLARSLAHCHEQGILHRDLKPGNVIVDAAGHPRIVDFGLSHRVDDAPEGTLTMGFVGTPAYVAPEQVRDKRTGAQPASDVFALGVLAWELLTLEHPFLRDTLVDTHAAILDAPPPRSRPRLPQDLDRVLHAALEKDPARRLPGAAQFAADLAAARLGDPVSVGRPGLRTLLRRLSVRHRRALVVASGIGLLALAGAGVSTVRALQARSEALAELDGLLAGLGATESIEVLEDPQTLSEVEQLARDAAALDRSLGGRLAGLDSAGRVRAAVLESLEPHFLELDERVRSICATQDWNRRYRDQRELADRLQLAVSRWSLLLAPQSSLTRFEGLGVRPQGQGAETFCMESGLGAGQGRTVSFREDRIFTPCDHPRHGEPRLILIRIETEARQIGGPGGERVDVAEQLRAITPLDPEDQWSGLRPTFRPEARRDFLQRARVVSLEGARTSSGTAASAWNRVAVLPELVTWSDLETWLGPDYRAYAEQLLSLAEATNTERNEEDATELPWTPSRADDAPALLSTPNILFVAECLGARLLTTAELRAVLAIEPEEGGLEAPSSLVDKEWVAGLAPSTRTMGFLRLDDLRSEAPRSRSSVSLPMGYVQGSMESGTGFRIAIGIGEPSQR